MKYIKYFLSFFQMEDCLLNIDKKAKKKLKIIISYLQKNYLTREIIVISVISMILLIKLSPILSIIWLNISTLYFMYIRNYKDIVKIWSFTIGIWYIIFSTSLSSITILIGFENTKIIINYLLDNDFMFETLCFQTVYILDGLSAKLGFSIYIPAVINIFSFFSKLFNNKKAGCSSKEDSGDGKKKSSRFSFGKTEKSQSEDDMSKCEALARELERSKTRGVFHSSKSTTNGNRTVTYSRTWVPGYGIQTNCHARDANKLEEELFKNSKKK